MSRTIRHNVDHGPAVVETMLDFCRAVQKTSVASVGEGASDHLVNFGDNEIGRALDKSEVDKSERIRLKNRRAQQKLRDRMRHDVEGLEAELKASKETRLALQLERQELENQFSAVVHALAVKGMFPVVEGTLRPKKVSIADSSFCTINARESFPDSVGWDAVDKILRGVSDSEAAVNVFSKEQRKLNELSLSGRLVEMKSAFELIIASFWYLSQEKSDIFSGFLLSGLQRPSEAQINKSYELIANEIKLSPSEARSTCKLLHEFSLDLKKRNLAMEWSSNELAYTCNGDDNLEVCFTKSSWNLHYILRKACAGAQVRLMFAVFELFAKIQQVMPLEKFACIWALSPTVIPDLLALCYAVSSCQR